MRCTVIAFYEDSDPVNNAYREYWNKRAEANPRFMGFLLDRADVHEGAWRSAKDLGFQTPEGEVNFIAFGIDGSHPRNHFHPTGRCPRPQLLIIVNLPVARSLDILREKGISSLRGIHADAKLVLSGTDQRRERAS